MCHSKVTARIISRIDKMSSTSQSMKLQLPEHKFENLHFRTNYSANFEIQQNELYVLERATVILNKMFENLFATWQNELDVLCKVKFRNVPFKINGSHNFANRQNEIDVSIHEASPFET